MKLGELTVTSVKTADGRSAQGDALLTKNIPSHVAIENLKRLCKWLEHLRRGLALGSGPDEKVAKRLYVSTRPQCEAMRQYQTPSKGVCGSAKPQREAMRRMREHSEKRKHRNTDLIRK